MLGLSESEHELIAAYKVFSIWMNETSQHSMTANRLA